MFHELLKLQKYEAIVGRNIYTITSSCTEIRSYFIWTNWDSKLKTQFAKLGSFLEFWHSFRIFQEDQEMFSPTSVNILRISSYQYSRLRRPREKFTVHLSWEALAKAWNNLLITLPDESSMLLCSLDFPFRFIIESSVSTVVKRSS